ncbi:MAG: SlyX protein [Betaproteobacteria bacterium HGW-Betaproteobacteria-7]|jgi:SlyX protein|nr:MAG: SlyX protein [Betaproteobacteria bacterium HGW-Betaproteobacteria-7]
MANETMNTTDTRITDLEIKISYAEDLIDELNRTVYRQQQQIDLLLVEIKALRDMVRNAPPAEARNLRDEIPPHY